MKLVAPIEAQTEGRALGNTHINTAYRPGGGTANERKAGIFFGGIISDILTLYTPAVDAPVPAAVRMNRPFSVIFITLCLRLAQPPVEGRWHAVRQHGYKKCRAQYPEFCAFA